MSDWLAAIPPGLWAAAGVVGGALVTVLGSWLVRRHQSKSDAGALALDMAMRLDKRVEVLERERNAYRSWTHVLWWHIHDERVPRIPAPEWPADLAR